MKLGLKLIAAVAALASVSGANAAAWPESSNPQVAVVAYNQVTRSWFVQDVGIAMNAFLPNGTVLGPGEANGVEGTITPDAGLNISRSFSGFSAWYAEQSTPSTSVRWFLAAADSENFFDGNESRLVLTSKSSLFPPGGAQSNGTLDIITGTGLLGGLGTLYGGGDVVNDTDGWATGRQAPVEWDNLINFGSGAGYLATVGDSVGLYYFTRTLGAFGDINAPVNRVRYGNADFFSTVTLNADGSFAYDLQPAVSPIPLPASVWLMGAGLAALGGVVRRRRVTGQA